MTTTTTQVVTHSVLWVLAAVVGGVVLMHMPDGTGPVLAVPMERLARLEGSRAAVAAALDRDPGDRLRRCRHAFSGKVVGPETVCPYHNGSLYVLDRYGQLRRGDPSEEDPSGFALSGDDLPYIGPGRPLGYTRAGPKLLVADSLKGLLELDLPTRSLRVLANRHAYVNDLDALPGEKGAPYGKVYYTSSTAQPPELARDNDGAFYDTMGAYLRCMMRGDATGRLLEYDPATHAVREVVTNLWFANGVALAKGGDFVLVVETLGLRVLRAWLRGPRAGTVEPFVEGLPGFPDGISRSEDGRYFWLAVIAPWTPLLKLMRYRAVRGVLARMLPAVPRFARALGLVLKLRAEDGAVVDVLRDAAGDHVSRVSAVTEWRGRLLLGQLQGSSVPVCDLAEMGGREGQAPA
mmetsp:Transcript_19254/g.64526  ORF Transcript_19254/g.64526 Transcript_19254/m.64526 type:complete len:406 (+) Transcript_19254:85-1302(+)